MKSLPFIDLIIVIAYLAGMVAVGIYFSRKNTNAEQFTKASGRIPGWAIGISIYATFLSSNTFLGVPGKAFGSNWSSFVFSLSMPLAAWVATKFFIPFYRSTGEVSAYTHLEHRFGSWARTYAVACFLLTQLARMGSIFFGIALSLQALTGYPMSTIMVVVGICIVLYTVMGGMEAVIWTEVVQGVIKTIGALVILYLVVSGVSGGMPSIIEIGKANDKFSLGTLAPDFTTASFWVILLYGFFMNLNNFGMDQNYVQRYHTTSSAKEAAGSVWLCVYLYVPVSLIFFLLGTCLFAYYQGNPELLQTIKMQVAAEKLPGGTSDAITSLAATLTPADYGDKVMPHFMVNKVPVGLLGLIIAAIMSAAMSTISSGMNASATVFSVDIYQKYIKSDLTPQQSLRLLYIATTVFGLLGMITGIAMIGVKSVLDVWWMLSGIFAGGMLGLFLLGMISKSTRNTEALTATIIGIVVIVWMTFSSQLPDTYSYLRNPLHQNMIMVVGTLTIFLAGVLLTRLRRKQPVEKEVLLHSK
ncbi:SSS family solute:Na+ symporter [Dyadobacter sp. BE34]|uniref:SSS family solute:Na+ symporter n=1 Tax=Dyadobacter fermentans TaxID=94254 RepID=A0ABU1R893_9BACT|nr:MULTISPECIES: sodium:solute symporter [Dyadobacter]MDR6809432.1 SSS family solute:Na+ symporter [Dyadobacter fermentans]MDR7047382.1 SSS family solute:Na+ symporter [Dyadobacter sp. BE242]MDR7195059.1 SSS family solute:Na+ symporter [Dyadobacter sp. BE34]MDR7214396.1 SSS family solute:Na+ symporter [Dyadobacter sp. BE31]MDR7266981.1 SSS family solute:Na+ symporter [Dyadobacter sp. BE32]